MQFHLRAETVAVCAVNINDRAHLTLDVTRSATIRSRYRHRFDWFQCNRPSWSSRASYCSSSRQKKQFIILKHHYRGADKGRVANTHIEIVNSSAHRNKVKNARINAEKWVKGVFIVYFRRRSSEIVFVREALSVSEIRRLIRSIYLAHAMQA